MKLKNTSIYTLKAWGSTLVIGSIIAFLILTIGTDYATEIKTPADFIVNTIHVIIIGAFVTSPLAIIFYTLLELILERRLSLVITKGLMGVIGAILIYSLFYLMFGKSSQILLNQGSPMIFFYCFFLVMTISVLVLKL